MVKRILALTLLFFLPALQAATLELQLDKSRLENGKFLLAKIIYRGVKTPGALDLSQWREDFFIDRNDPEISTSADGQVEVDISARLYPRRSGDLILQAIALGGAIARPAHVLVAAPIRNGVDATPKLRALKSYYWADQAIDIVIEAPLHDARNEIVADDFVAENFSVVRLPDRRIKTAQGESVLLHWRLLSARKGFHSLELPTIQQRGRGRFRFHLPKLSLRIKPLPAYLPPTVIVGQPMLTSSLQQNGEQAKILQIEITNHGRLPTQPEGMAELFQSLGVEESAIESRDEIREGVARRIYRIQLPTWFAPQRAEINLAYFNSESGRLENLHHRTPWLWRLPRYMTWLGLLIALLALIFIFYRIDQLAERLRQRHRLRQQIRQSANAHQIRRLLLQYSQTKTLQEWRKQQRKASARQVAEALNRACFGRERSAPESIRKDCLKLL